MKILEKKLGEKLKDYFTRSIYVVELQITFVLKPLLNFLQNNSEYEINFDASVCFLTNMM